MKNTFDDSRIDGRDLYALRGSIRIQPTSSTTIDLIGYYFREEDDRSRIQKQLCTRDNTGILGCRPDSLAFETVNGNATLAAILTSREFFRINNAALTNFGLGSLYGADNFFGGVVNPADLRTVRTDFNPTYFAEEEHLMARIEQEIGDTLDLTVTGGWTQQAGRQPHRLQSRRRQFAGQQSGPADPGRNRGGARRALPGRSQSLRPGAQRADPQRARRRRLHVGDQSQLHRHLRRLRQPLLGRAAPIMTARRATRANIRSRPISTATSRGRSTS